MSENMFYNKSDDLSDTLAPLKENRSWGPSGDRSGDRTLELQLFVSDLFTDLFDEQPCP